MTNQAKTGVIEVAEDVFAFIQEGGATPDPATTTNGGFIVGEEGVIVVDGLMTNAMARRVQQEVKRITQAPIRCMILTHFHGDHSLANQNYLSVPIIGHSGCRADLIERWDATVENFSTRFPELAAEFHSARMVPPNLVYDRGLTLYLGSHEINLIHPGRAHTRGDTLVYLPQDRVLYAGDVVFNRQVPGTGSGHLRGWMSTLRKIQTLHVDTIVPGHGLLGDVTIVKDLHRFFSALKREAQKRFRAGMGAEEAAKDIRLPQFRSWRGIDQLAAAVQWLYTEFRSEL